MFLLPERIREFFRKNKEKVKRAFLLDRDFAVRLHERAESQGRTEADVLAELASKGQEQVRRQEELEACWDALTEREREVLALACMGKRNYEIAQVLGISYGTVQSHFQNIFRKLRMRSKREIRLALRDWQFEEWWQGRHK
jgi:RNA polymerase sigma factor (sigma-70 family)